MNEIYCGGNYIFHEGRCILYQTEEILFTQNEIKTVPLNIEMNNFNYEMLLTISF